MSDRLGGPGTGTALLGRGAECAELDGLVADVRAGRSRSTVLRGEAGIGKTALLEYLVAAGSDLTLVRTVGVESEMELAYAGLHRLCVPLLDRRSELPTPQRQALEIVFGLSFGPAPDRFLVALGVLSLVSHAADAHPLLCVIDDAQWLDQASALTLAFVARRLLAERVGIVFAARETGEELQQLPVLDVRGLSKADAQALLSSTVRFRVDTRVQQRIVEETDGNPLALIELPRGLSPTELAGGFGLIGGQSLTGRIEASFVRRCQALSDNTRRLLLVAAADPAGDPRLLWRAAERLGIQVGADLDSASDGLLTLGERVTFRHPLARSAVYRSAAVGDRRAVHSALAEAIDSDSDPDRRAWHLAAAAPGPDEQVALELERSATRAQARGGLAAAAAFLQRAVALTPGPAQRARRALAAAEPTMHAGAFDAARGLLGTAQAGPLDELERARVEWLQGRLTLYSTYGSDAPPLLLQAAQRLERLDVELARDTYVDAWGAALLAGRLHPGGVLDVSRAASSAPREPGAAQQRDLLLDSLATLVNEGRTAARALLEEAARTFAEDDVGAEGAIRWGWLAVVPTYALWDEERNHKICVRQLEALRDAGAFARLLRDLSSFILLAVRCGDFPRAEEGIAEGDAIAAATGTEGVRGSSITLAVFRGHEAQARPWLESQKAQAEALGQGIVLGLTEWLFAVLCNGLGRYQEAVAAAPLTSESPDDVFVSTWTAIEVLEAATRSDNPDLARAALEHIETRTAFARSDSAQGILARSRALVSEGETAERLYQEAIQRLGRTRLRPESARAQLLYGEWLRRADRALDARTQLRAAHDQFASIGMEAFAERSRRELQAVGGKVRTRPVETRVEMTPQERQIARLASDGLSNTEIGARLFLSPRTVEWHLGKVFTKLRIRSRQELARFLGSESELVSA